MVKLSQIFSVLSLALIFNAKDITSSNNSNPDSIEYCETANTTEQLEPERDNPSSNVFYGFAYNARHSSGECPNLKKVIEDLAFLKKYSTQVRTFGILDCNQGELVLQAAHKTGMNLALGMWLNETSESFSSELNGIKNLVKNYGPAFKSRVHTIVVGSETLLRHDQTYESLTGHMKDVKNYLKNEAKLPNIKVTTGETLEYWENRQMQDNADYIFLNSYPYFDKVPFSNATNHFFSRIKYIKSLVAASGKEVVISETGWPEGGATIGGAVPSLENHQEYTDDIACRSKTEGLKVYMFSAFDESWKPHEELSNWGVFKKANVLKPGFSISCGTLPPVSDSACVLREKLPESSDDACSSCDTSSSSSTPNSGASLLGVSGLSNFIFIYISLYLTIN